MAAKIITDEFLVGSVFHPHKKEYLPVIGHHFNDSPGYYQFYVIGGSDHFRKSPNNDDRVNPISFEVFHELRNLKIK